MIAVLINVHKNEEQVQRLINRLKHREIDIYIHIDKKFGVDSFDDSISINNRHDVKWGGDSVVNSIISSLREIDKSKYSHIILLSGQDYPLVSSDDIVKFLNGNKGKAFLNYVKIGSNDGEWDIANRYTSYRFRNRILDGISRRLWNRREILKGKVHYGGSLWWILTGEMASYLVQQFDGLNLMKKIRYTNCSDEVIFQTVLCNSKFKDNIINDDCHYIDWSDHMNNLNKGNPNVLREDDYDKIISSGKLFARKFDMAVDNKILDKIDKYIDDKNRVEK